MKKAENTQLKEASGEGKGHNPILGAVLEFLGGKNEDCHSHGDEHSCDEEHSHDEAHEFTLSGLSKYVLGAGLTVIGFLTFFPLYITIPAAALSYLFFGFTVWREMIENFREKNFFTEFSLMCLATVGAAVLGEYADAAAVMYLYSLGEAISGLAYSRSKHNIAGLIEIIPKSVGVLREGVMVIVKPSEVRIGEAFVVCAGERIALDGVVIDGGGTADTSSVTGESLPVDLFPGYECVSGSLVLSGAVTVRASAEYENSVAGGLIKAVEEASEKKAKTEKKITAFAKVFTPVAFLVSAIIFALVAIFTKDVAAAAKNALVVLVISCPCSLVLSVPLTYFAGIGSAAKKGIVFRGGEVIDSMKNLSAVIFDKTGTLTDSDIEYKGAVVAEGVDERRFIDICYSALLHSPHVTAKSFCSAMSRKSRYGVSDVEVIPGRGIACKVCGTETLLGNLALLEDNYIKADAVDTTVIYVAFGGKYVGRLEFASHVKSGTADEIKKMRELGVGRIAVMSGDTKASVETAAGEAGIDEYYAALTPRQKLNRFNGIYKDEHTDKKAVVAFCGDGMNDSAVIARADVGIAMGSGAAVSVERADVVLTDNSIAKINEAIVFSKKISGIANQNIIISLAVKAAAVLLGVLAVRLSLPAMEIAVAADVGAAVATVLNSIRAGKL